MIAEIIYLLPGSLKCSKCFYNKVERWSQTVRSQLKTLNELRDTKTGKLSSLSFRLLLKNSERSDFGHVTILFRIAFSTYHLYAAQNVRFEPKKVTMNHVPRVKKKLKCYPARTFSRTEKVLDLNVQFKTSLPEAARKFCYNLFLQYHTRC